MNAPTTKTLLSRLEWLDKLKRQGPEITARTARSLMRFSAQQGAGFRAAMEAIDSLLETHGVERISSSCGRYKLWYCNTGDAYINTVGLSGTPGRTTWYVGSWGDWLERMERRGAKFE